MSSVKNINDKITLLERRVKYGTNGGINCQTQLTFNNNNVVIAKNGVPHRDAFLSDNFVTIGSDISSSEGYSTYIHGRCLGGGYFNTLMGYDSTMPYGVNNTVVLGPKITTVGNGSVCVGSKANSSIQGTSVGHQAGISQSSTSSSNTMIGRAAGVSIVNGSSNIALGHFATFTGDVSNCLSINNQNNSAIGGIYGINMGTTSFNLGINKNTPVTTLDVSGNIKTNAGSLTMTNGFTYIPAASGPPTGVPTSITGSVPMYADTLNNRFYLYIGGNWRYAALT